MGHAPTADARDLHDRTARAQHARLVRERHSLMLGVLDERWWEFRRRRARLAALAAVEEKLGLDRKGLPW